MEFRNLVDWGILLKWVLKNNMRDCGVNSLDPCLALVNKVIQLMNINDAKTHELMN
jgi:hypothetical protein